MPRTRSWTENTVRSFWDARSSATVITHSHSLVQPLLQTETNREAVLNSERVQYFQNVQCDASQISNAHSPEKQLVKDLAFWIKYLSWTYCKTCKLLTKQVLPHNFASKSITKPLPCICKSNKYIVPDSDDLPLALSQLTMEDIFTLRPFDIHCGDIKRAKNGYRLKSGPFRLSLSKQSVLQKIDALNDEQSKHRCTIAYAFLINCSESSYSQYVTLREELVTTSKQLTLYDVLTSKGLECALWPSLYPYTSWCESSLSGHLHRESCKTAFMAKVFSNTTDYAMLFELLLFQYDRWLFKTVTGAINTARVLNCSPMRALESKTFSPGYWRWQHLFLLDAVNQFGLPSLFITISPYEWTFPFPYWLDNVRQTAGVGKTFLAGYETIHIANVLEQLVRGYLCGSNSARWSKHLFHRDLPSTEKNVLTYFYRFEFQKRGTLHLHLLVWLKDIKHIQFKRIRADIPLDDHDLGFLATRLQKSSEKSPFLHVRNEPTAVEHANGKDVLHVIHPANAYAQNLRAYIDTILPVLKCSMDVQSTDGRSMLLKYVSSYVSKWHDAVDVESLYSPNVTGHQAAFRYLRSLSPCEPEMWMALTSIKIAWSKSRTKKYVVPLPHTAERNKDWVKYRQRPQTLETYTFAEWLRAVDNTSTQPKLYKSGNTLVGLRFVSIYRNEFFFQQLLMHFPHRQLNELYHGDFDRMPEILRYFASAIRLLNKWNDTTSIRQHFEQEGHKQYYIDTVVFFLDSLKDLLQSWRLHVLKTHELGQIVSPFGGTAFNLKGKQLVILQHLKSAVRARNDCLAFETRQSCSDDMEIDSEIEDMDIPERGPPFDEPLPHLAPNLPEIDWKQYLLVTGNPGCGKTHAMNACISECLQHNLKVLVVAPTGFLACKFKTTFGEDITTDTVHAAFHYPVDDSTAPAINWELARFDFIVIDEISMIAKPIFNHVMTTFKQLPVRPIVFFSGDEAQQQPIMTLRKKIVQVDNIMSDREFITSVRHIKLTEQFRCQDDRLQDFLSYIRNWIPTQSFLNSIQTPAFSNGEPCDETIIDALKAHPDATVLTVTKKACNRINNLVVMHGFPEQQPLAVLQTDCELPPIPIYQGMRVMLTQNRDKRRGFVNGQLATIKSVTRKTVFASLIDGRILNIYLVSYRTTAGELKTVYPFVPAYANTICKAQGQTLSKVLLWFDIDNVPSGSAYVAVSRVRTLENLLFLTPMKVCHFTPVSR